ncbi:MAG TPA: efflux transporter outer membrane subunit [Terriglobales bacterium]|nr:efflux transporter outer membrane subunit [Terriglobales bacterium]
MTNPFDRASRPVKPQLLALLLSGLLVVDGCEVGPKYHTPSVPAPPPAFRELTPEDMKVTEGWKVAQPKDSVLHGAWWEIFHDPQLNTLEEQVNVSNQSIAAAFSSYMAARALVKEARSQYFPTVTTNPSITNQRTLSGLASSTPSHIGSFTEYSLPFEATWVPDLWGRVRNSVRANVAGAQANAADLENTRLAIESELAVDYFQLRGQDALKDLLDTTVVAYRESLRLTRALYETGIDSDEAVALAETQLESTMAADTNLGILRAQYQHAIAMLVAQPASSFAITGKTWNATPPAIPLGVPSLLLERRPDVAAAERLVAEANAQIGIAKVAYYPTLTLGGSVGFASTSFADWFTWPSRVWSVGPSLAQTLFDAGLRRATVEQFRAQYDASVANYRQTVLTAFQQVEDNLAALRILSVQLEQQESAVSSAQRNLSVATDRYKLGIDPYLNVIAAQTALLNNQQTTVNLRIQQMTASVQLIEALGGGWDSSQLPTGKQMVQNTPHPPASPTNPPANSQTPPTSSSNP